MKLLKDKLPILLFILLLAGCWELGPRVFDVPAYIIPRLSDVIAALGRHAALLSKHFALTLWEALLGLVFSVVFGVLSAIWIDGSSLARKTIYPLIVASQTIPIIALSPIMVMWFGYEIGSKISVVILFTFFPVAVNTADGFRTADREIGELLRSMGAGKAQLFLKWKIPSALPSFFTGLKMAAAISVGGATLGEWLGGESGLGVYTKRAANMLRGDDVFAGVLLLSLMGIALFVAAQIMERLVLGHRRV
ncbi:MULTISPECIES: ABC transporter permease [unclassified Paenibacillus]|uniref:ABC transporter permease n=1 Tax=unclassified Paenibacillus TaxID=185978 RepID=UPI00104EF628|nr:MULTISPECIES: ABC transporter permease [unclassified Paenibacillus]NIK70674.1 putative hydroxymethylpyrimidine transport system permease protein [Paenibacillus sp. BK720]TCM93353.1 putative hydroxymethylpyrimidine transport system permease protein [Paenibacillus sp. BK033]